MGKFEKGNPGRPIGAKNKMNTEIRDRIQNLFDNNFATIQKDLESLDSKDRLKFLTDLLPYLIPKLQATTLSQEINLETFPEDQLDRLLDRYINE